MARHAQRQPALAVNLCHLHLLGKSDKNCDRDGGGDRRVGKGRKEVKISHPFLHPSHTASQNRLRYKELRTLATMKFDQELVNLSIFGHIQAA